MLRSRLEGDSTARATLNDVVVCRLQETAADTQNTLADSFINGETLRSRYGDESSIVDAK